jgi:group II intron reverse transcriptase/maturase
MKRSNQQQVGAQLSLIPKKRKEMSSAERVQLYQRKLYLKAKQESGYRFYVLYDKIFLPYVLEEAWRRVKANGGSAGVDGETIEAVEAKGEGDKLKGIAEELRKQTYQPSAVKRVWISKSNGGKRPLGIPTVKDRVAQMACTIVIEPIFEADFEESSYGFRPKRSASDAVAKIKAYLKSGKTEIYDADLSKYFDTIPHDRLMIALKERIVDQRVLKLIHKWLKAPVSEDGQFKGGRKNEVGTPQGGVISPLLANLYLHLLDRIVNSTRSIFRKTGVTMVRYADDFVLMGVHLPPVVMYRLKELLGRMGLTLNEQKSAQINAQQTPLNFLGFTFRYDRNTRYPEWPKFWNVKPSEKSNKRIREKIGIALKQMGHYNPEELVRELNAIMRGWLNYFDIKGVSYPYQAKLKLNYYLRMRLTRYFNRKSQRKSRLYRKQAFELLVNKYGLIDPLKFVPVTYCESTR